MDVNPAPEYKEELPRSDLKPEQYFSLAMQAVKILKWQVVSVTEHEIVCYTPDGGRSFGETISISIDGEGIFFHSRSNNEYYWTEGQNQANAIRFRKAIDRITANNRDAEKKRNPLLREPFGALVPSKTYVVTPVLIYLNVAVFLVMVLAGVSPVDPDARTLLAWGGNFRPLTAGTEEWRLFSYMFLHGGIMHILMNMFALAYIGLYLEPLLGKLRFSVAYVLTGICAGLLSVFMHPFTVGVGASGAIFGLYGVFLAMLTTSHIEKTARNTMLMSILFFVVYNLVSGLHGNIDNAAHIGGLLSGLIIGYMFYPGLAARHDNKKQLKVSSIATIVVAILVIVTLRCLR